MGKRLSHLRSEILTSRTGRVSQKRPKAWPRTRRAAPAIAAQHGGYLCQLPLTARASLADAWKPVPPANQRRGQQALRLRAWVLKFPLLFTSVQSPSCLRLFVTPWITARQASLSITNSWSLLKLMSIEWVMPSSHLILLSPSPPVPNPYQHQDLFQWVNSSHEVAKVLEFQLQHQSFQWTPRTDLL